MLPPIRHLLPQPLLLLLVNVVQVLKLRGALRDERALLQQRENVLREAPLLVEARDVVEELVARDALEGVADLALEGLGEVRDGGAALGFFFCEAVLGVLGRRVLAGGLVSPCDAPVVSSKGGVCGGVRVYARDGDEKGSEREGGKRALTRPAPRRPPPPGPVSPLQTWCPSTRRKSAAACECLARKASSPI